MFKGSATMRMALYIVSIVVNAAVYVVRPLDGSWGDALQYLGGALAAFTGVVALTNVEKESSASRVIRKIETGQVTVPPVVRCPFIHPSGEQCILGAGHDITYGHPIGEPNA